MDFSIIIVNYNLTNEVKNCITSLLKVFNDTNYEIILIDNNSEDKSITKIADNFKETLSERFSFLSSEKNIGFGNACNLAVKESKGKTLFFLNPDTIIKQNFLFDINRVFYESEFNAGIVGLSVNAGKYLDYSAGVFPNFLLEFLNIFLIGRFVEAFHIKIKASFSVSKKLSVDWVMGAAFFIRKDIFDMLGGFDPDYFLYFEEMDLCYRVKLNGYSVMYLPDILVDHIGSVSSKKNYYFFTKMFYKGKLLFLKKHTSKLLFKFYTLLLKLHFLNQIFFWFALKILNKEKSLGKNKAFRELLRSATNPETISNQP